MTTCCIYTRQSLDKTGEGLGVERQESECRRLTTYRGWEVTHVLRDNSQSASTGERPEYKRLLGLIESRSIDVVVVLRVDRLLRKLTDLENLIDLCERTGVKIVTVEGDLQLDTASGRLLGRILASVARAEVETKSARQKLANRQKAAAGKPHGSRRCYGYESDNVTVREDEALVLKDMAARFLSGWSYRELTDYLNAQGITTSEGKPWLTITVRNMLTRKRYAGVREYEGTQYEGIWPAIFDADTWDRLQYEIKRRKVAAGSPKKARRYLLTGLLFCGACGEPLNGAMKRDHPDRPLRRTYVCLGCHGVIRGSVPLEHFIRELICYRLDTADLGQGGQSARPLLEKKAAFEARLVSLLDDYTDGTLSKLDYKRARGRVEAQLREVERSLSDAQGSELLRGLSGGDMVRARWLAEKDGWRRALVDLLVERITVNVGKTKPFYVVDGVRYRFDSRLIDVIWRQ